MCRVVGILARFAPLLFLGIIFGVAYTHRDSTVGGLVAWVTGSLIFMAGLVAGGTGGDVFARLVIMDDEPKDAVVEAIWTFIAGRLDDTASHS